jgi:hypothetical protein
MRRWWWSAERTVAMCKVNVRVILWERKDAPKWHGSKRGKIKLELFFPVPVTVMQEGESCCRPQQRSCWTGKGGWVGGGQWVASGQIKEMKFEPATFGAGRRLMGP